MADRRFTFVNKTDGLTWPIMAASEARAWKILREDMAELKRQNKAAGHSSFYTPSKVRTEWTLVKP